MFWRVCFVVALCMPLIACGHWRENFLEDMVGNGTQADVQERLGKPHRTKESLLTGDSIWVYRFVLSETEVNPVGSAGRGVTDLANSAAALIGKGGGGDQGAEKMHCFRYELKFNPDKVLEEWQREKC